MNKAAFGLFLWALGASASPILGRNITTVSTPDGGIEHVSGVDDIGKQVLDPGVHWDLNTADMKHVVPISTQKLHYGITNSSEHGYVATIDMRFKLPSINLDHTDHIQEEVVDPSTFKMTFSGAESFKVASDTWKSNTGNGSLLLITNADGCDRQLDGDRCFFRADSLQHDEAAKVITAKGVAVHLLDVITTGSAQWGWHTGTAPAPSKALEARRNVVQFGPKHTNSAFPLQSMLDRLKGYQKELQEANSTIQDLVKDINAAGPSVDGAAALLKAQADVQRLQTLFSQTSKDFGQMISGMEVSTYKKPSRKRAAAHEALEVRDLLDTIKSEVNKAGAAIQGGFNSLKDKITGDAHKLKDSESHEVRSLIARHELEARGFLDGLGNTFGGVASQVGNVFQGAASTVVNGVEGVATTVANGVQGVATTVANGVEGAATTVAQVAEGAATTVVSVAQAAATAAVQEGQNVVNAIMNDAKHDWKFQIPNNDPDSGLKKLIPAGDSPFGPNAIKVASVHSQKSTTGKNPMTGTTFSGDVDVYCVDCSVSGDITVAGTVHFGDGNAVSGGLSVQSNLHTTIKAGFDVQGIEIEKDIYVPVFNIPLGPFGFGPIEIGPWVEVGVKTVLDAVATGTLLVGADVDLKGGDVELDFGSPEKSTMKTWDPKITPTVNATGDLQLSAQVGIPVSINFGVSVGAIRKVVALIDEPSIKGVAEVAASIGLDGGKLKGGITENKNGCKGIETTLSWKDELTFNAFDVFNKTLFTTGDKQILDKCIPIPGQDKDDKPTGDQSQGDQPKGDQTDGDQPEGGDDQPEGDQPDDDPTGGEQTGDDNNDDDTDNTDDDTDNTGDEYTDDNYTDNDQSDGAGPFVPASDPQAASSASVAAPPPSPPPAASPASPPPPPPAASTAAPPPPPAASSAAAPSAAPPAPASGDASSDIQKAADAANAAAAKIQQQQLEAMKQQQEAIIKQQQQQIQQQQQAQQKAGQ